MKLRYISIFGIAGLVMSLMADNLTCAFITVFGCGVLYTLRCIECQIGDMKSHIPKRLSEREQLLNLSFGLKPRTLVERTREVFSGQSEAMVGARSRSSFMVAPAVFSPSNIRCDCGNYRNPAEDEVKEFMEREAFG